MGDIAGAAWLEASAIRSSSESRYEVNCVEAMPNVASKVANEAEKWKSRDDVGFNEVVTCYTLC